MWNTDRAEIFRLLWSRWDIRKAKQILAATPSRVVRTCEVKPFESTISRRLESGAITIGVRVDWDRVQHDATIDLTVPIILGTLEDADLLLDGYHRVAKALRTRVATLPCVVLTRDETENVRIR